MTGQKLLHMRFRQRHLDIGHFLAVEDVFAFWVDGAAATNSGPTLLRLLGPTCTLFFGTAARPSSPRLVPYTS